MIGLDWSDETVAVGGANLVVQKAGSGPPLLILHEELGCPGTVSWQETMARSRTLVVPQHPGFGRSERAEWIVCVRDLACLYAMYLRKQKLAPAAVIGFSFGGWIAAEMAANDPALFSKLVLVGAHGIKPPEGEILDQFMLTADEYLRQSVVDPSATDEFLKLYGGEITPEQYEAFEEARAETARLAWKPFMFNPSLPHLLEAAAGLDTLLIWGGRDAVAPPSIGVAYKAAIPGAKLVTLSGCGHRPEIEKRDAFLSEVQEFLS